MVLQWGATDRGLAEALAGVGIDIETAMPDVEEDFLGMLDDLLRAGQRRARCGPISACAT